MGIQERGLLRTELEVLGCTQPIRIARVMKTSARRWTRCRLLRHAIAGRFEPESEERVWLRAAVSGMAPGTRPEPFRNALEV